MSDFYTPPVGDVSKLINAQANNASQKQTGTSELGKDDFLKILITQLQNQDPMEPMQDKDFIAQMAQFSSLEQMTNVATGLSKLPQMLGYASTLIGKTISWSAVDENGASQDKSGVVDSIVVKDGTQYAVVKGENVALDQVTKVAAGEAAN